MFVRVLILPLLWCLACAAYADADVEFSGFGTLTAVSSNSDIYGFRPDLSYDGGSTDGDIDFLAASLLGAQLDYQVSDSLNFTAQGIIRDRVENHLDNVVSQFFFKYSFNPGLNMRLGRLPLDLFALTEYRDITYAYPWAVAPIEVYGMVPNRSVDGLDLSYTKRLSASAITAKVYVGMSETTSSSRGNVDVSELKDIVGFSLDWSTLDWYLKFRHTQAVFKEDSPNAQNFLDNMSAIPSALWPNGENFVDNYSFANKRIKYTSASGQYTLDRWTLGGEYAWIGSEAAAVERVEGGYASLTYRVDDLAGFVLLGVADSNTYSFNETITIPPEFFPNYDEFAFGITAAMNAFSTNQHSVAIGARYELSDAMALKIQWTKTDIKQWGGSLWYTDSIESTADKIDTVVLSMSFIF